MRKLLVLFMIVSFLVGCTSPTLEERLSGEWISTERDVDVELSEGDYKFVSLHDDYNYDGFVFKRMIKYSPDGEYNVLNESVGKEYFYSLLFEEGICTLSNFTKSDIRSYDLEYGSENNYFQKLNLEKSKSNIFEKFEKDGFDVTVNFIDDDTMEVHYYISEEQLKGDPVNDGMKSLDVKFKYVRYVRVDD